MAIIVADVDLASRDDPVRALVTLSLLTGVVMIVAGLLRLGSFLRFVSNSVMTGFITAVGVNIVLGQLDDFTGYEADGANRVLRAFDLLLNFWKIDVPTIAVGATTIALIVILQRTRLGPLGLVVGVFAGSALGSLLRYYDADIVQVHDIAEVPRSLPLPMLPALRDVAALIVPAVSLAFVGLVQGAGVSAGFPNHDGSPQDESQDFVGQGAGNIAAGLFQGMPVGGSMSASSLMATGGARTRAAAFYAAGVMAVVIVLFGGVIELVAMPSLAGLLIVIGVATIKPARVMSVAKTGVVPLTVMSITFGLTLVVPLQYAVLVGVGISAILFVIQQSTRLVTKRLVFHDDGRVEETDPPVTVPPDEVIVLQPYGALFFATAATLVEQMPTVTPESVNSAVILRVRSADEAGARRRCPHRLPAISSERENRRHPVLRRAKRPGASLIAGVVRVLAEGVGFEPTEARRTSTVFETVPFVRSGSLPPLEASGERGGRLRADRAVVRGDERQQVLMDDVAHAVVAAIAGVFVRLDDDQSPVFERVGHRPRALEWRGWVARGADHHDRAGAGAGDLDARIERRREERARVRPRRVREDPWSHGEDLVDVGVSLLDGGSLLVVGAVDRLERLDQVAVGAVSTPAVVGVVQLQEPGAVAGPGVLECPLERRPVVLGVHRLRNGEHRHAAVDRSSITSTGQRRLVEADHQPIECAFGVAAVVERALRVGAALGEEGRERGLEAGALL